LEKFTVLIVDDSAVIRRIVREVFTSDDMVEIVGEADEPLAARDLIKEMPSDVLTFDVGNLQMSGFTFLQILKHFCSLPVMISTLTTKGADITLDALEHARKCLAIKCSLWAKFAFKNIKKLLHFAAFNRDVMKESLNACI
jgi:two-component system chemotaxis response regulator CheB